MALVAYDNSDSSEYEDDENEDTSTQLKEDEAKITNEATVQDSANELNPEGFTLFNKLPQPTHKKKEYVEEDDEFLHKKESLVDIKPKSRITIPSLSDFKDVKSTTAPISKSKIVNGKKSGLLSILPQPKNSVKSTVKSLIPNAVAHKPTTTVKKKEPLPSVAKLTKVDTKPALLAENSDESDDEVQNDFFSINKPVELPVDIPIEEPVDEVVEITKPKPRSIESYFKKDIVTEIQTNNEVMNEEAEFNLEMENVQEPSRDVLDEEAILKLCGSRGKRKREEIQIVDVNQQEVLDDARKWLLKGLMDDTTKRQSASKRKGNEPTNQQKRKHQITYLAHQAKANEAELQNQWANNRMTKRQTQSKYGF